MPVLCFLHFFTNLIYPSLKIISRICPEFFHIQNLSGSNLSCPEFIQVDLSRICPEFFMSGICSDLSVQNLSRIFHVQNLSRMCPEIVQIYLSRICPKFLYWTTSGQILDKVQFWILDLCQKTGQFLDNFRTHKNISEQFLDIFDDIFRTFIFYRVGHMIAEHLQ